MAPRPTLSHLAEILFRSSEIKFPPKDCTESELRQHQNRELHSTILQGGLSSLTRILPGSEADIVRRSHSLPASELAIHADFAWLLCT